MCTGKGSSSEFTVMQGTHKYIKNHKLKDR
jgi:hypothetical protein